MGNLRTKSSKLKMLYRQICHYETDCPRMQTSFLYPFERDNFVEAIQRREAQWRQVQAFVGPATVPTFGKADARPFSISLAQTFSDHSDISRDASRLVCSRSLRQNCATWLWLALRRHRDQYA